MIKIIKTIKLVPTFFKSDGRKHSLSIQNPTMDQSPEEIRESLELLTALDIFEKNGIKYFAEVDTCKYVETVKYIQFDPENNVAAEPLPEPEQPQQPETECPKNNIPLPASCLNPFKGFAKFVDLTSPAAMMRKPTDKLEEDIYRSEDFLPVLPKKASENLKSDINFDEESAELLDVAAPCETPTQSKEDSESKKPRRRKRLLRRLRELYSERQNE